MSGAPDPTRPYEVIEQGARVYRMTFMFDVEATAPAVAKFRTKGLIDAIFQMMSDDQAERLAGALAAGSAAKWVRGIAYVGDTESVQYPFDLAAFEQMRNAVLRAAVEAGAPEQGVGDHQTDAAALAGLGDPLGPGGREEASEKAQTDDREGTTDAETDTGIVTEDDDAV